MSGTTHTRMRVLPEHAGKEKHDATYRNLGTQKAILCDRQDDNGFHMDIVAPPVLFQKRQEEEDREAHTPEQGITRMARLSPCPYYTTHRLVLCDSTMYDQGVISFPLTQGTDSDRPMSSCWRIK